MMSKLLTPANAACCAAILSSAGVDIHEGHVRFVFEIIAAVAGVVGLVIAGFKTL